MKKIQRLVIADDLTGSNDAGVHFLSEEREVVVVVDPLADNPVHTAETLVINTDTRGCTPACAYEKVRSALERYIPFEPEEIFKKVDSTLRGNVGREIDAVMDVVGFRLACVATATPRNGRTVRDGVCYVNGFRLSDTEVARDPFSPVKFSEIHDILSEQSHRKISVLPLERIRSSRLDAMEFLSALIQSGTEIVVTDAETVEDLRIVRKLFADIPDPVLYIGSAGLFHAMKEPDSPEATGSLPGMDHRSRILFVIGSLMETTLTQVEHLERKNNLKACLVDTSAVKTEYEAEIERQAAGVGKSFLEKNIVVLRTDRSNTGETSVASRVGSALGEIVYRAAGSTDIDVLVVTGGDTALSVLKRLHIGCVRLIDEALPGIPVSEIHLPGRIESTLFVTKAGSYGEGDALAGVLEFLTDTGRHTPGSVKGAAK